MATPALHLADLPQAVQDELQGRGEVHLRLVVDNTVEMGAARSVSALFGRVKMAHPVTDQDIEAAIAQGASEDWRG